MLLKIKKSRIIEVIKNNIIVKKRAILLKTLLNLQKTSVDLSNLYASD